jgi:hypothetical protein
MFICSSFSKTFSKKFNLFFKFASISISSTMFYGDLQPTLALFGQFFTQKNQNIYIYIIANNIFLD